MTTELQKIADACEKELKQLEAAMVPHRAAYDKAQALAAPHEAAMKTEEAEMDKIKPRLHELREKLQHLRKAV